MSAAPSTARQCSGCTLCCRLLPMQAGGRKPGPETIDKLIALKMMTPAEAVQMVPDFNKPAGKRCPHQRHGKGCAIYARRPFGCRFWNCRWLTGDGTEDLPRPDRAHYVIDVSPDFITTTNDDTGERSTIEVIQIWCDPRYPDAHKDPKLRAYLDRRGEEGKAALIRLSARDGFVLFPPSMTGGEWIEKHTTRPGPEHSIEEKIAALGEFKVTIR